MDPRRREQTAGVVLPLLLTGVVLTMDRLEGPRTQYVGVLTAMPLLAAALARPLATAAVSAAVLAAAFGFGFSQVDDQGAVAGLHPTQLVRLAFISVASVLAVAVAEARRRADERAVAMEAVAEATQHAIMRPLPGVVGAVRCATRYQSATREASVGGDLVEVLDTPHGVRAVVGDARGKGLGAVRLAGRVLGCFREVAYTEPDLRRVATALDRAVRRDASSEDFVTAVLVELVPPGPDGSTRAQVVACGHPAPRLVSEQQPVAREVTTRPAPPLGLLPTRPEATAVDLAAGERMVLVTDGLLEARRAARWPSRGQGEFIPADRVLAQRLGAGEPGAGMEAVVQDVRRWTRGRMDDDMALLVLQPTTAVAATGDVLPGGPRRG